MKQGMPVTIESQPLQQLLACPAKAAAAEHAVYMLVAACMTPYMYIQLRHVLLGRPESRLWIAAALGLRTSITQQIAVWGQQLQTQHLQPFTQ
jgi:hypothetical protein